MYKKPQCTVTSRKKITSTPLKSSSEFNLTDLSMISAINSSGGNTSVGSKSKGSDITPDDLAQAHSIYLLNIATTKRQEATLSELTAKNEDKRLALLYEIEKKREYLKSLIECKAAVEFLSKQTRHQKEKEILSDVVDEVSDKLKNLDMLKNSLQMELPVKGFIPEKNPDELYYMLSQINNTLKVIDSAECRISTESADALDKTQESLSNIAELQSRCNTAASELNSRALEENVLKVVKAMELNRQNKEV